MCMALVVSRLMFCYFTGPCVRKGHTKAAISFNRTKWLITCPPSNSSQTFTFSCTQFLLGASFFNKKTRQNLPISKYLGFHRVLINLTYPTVKCCKKTSFKSSKGCTPFGFSTVNNFRKITLSLAKN